MIEIRKDIINGALFRCSINGDKKQAWMCNVATLMVGFAHWNVVGQSLLEGVLNTLWPKTEQRLFLAKLHMAQNGYHNLNYKL
jgi:hypothetical protein